MTAHPGQPLGKSAVGVGIATMLSLSVPAIAMQFTDEVVGNIGDFAAAAGLLVGAVLSFLLLARRVGTAAGRAAVTVSVLTALAAVWAGLATG